MTTRLSLSVSLSWTCWLREVSCWCHQVFQVSAAPSEPPTCRRRCSCWRSCVRLPSPTCRTNAHLTPADTVSPPAARNHGRSVEYCPLKGAVHAFIYKSSSAFRLIDKSEDRYSIINQSDQLVWYIFSFVPFFNAAEPQLHLLEDLKTEFAQTSENQIHNKNS